MKPALRTSETHRPPAPTLCDRALGAYLGLAVGDALGATVEFMTAREIQYQYVVHNRIVGGGWLKLKPGQVTDDTQMSLYLGRAIIASGGWDLKAVCDGFADWLRTKPIDIGNTCRRGIMRYIHEGTMGKPYNDGDAGNGAAMRLLPVALSTFGDPQACAARILAQARITHNHPLSDDACLSLARMIHAALADGGVKAIRAEANALIEKHKDFRFAPYRGMSSAYIVDTMQTVLHHFFATDNFRDLLVGVVNQGGDADTTGAIAGMIGGALYGASAIPEEWRKKLDPAATGEIRRQAPALFALSRFARKRRDDHG